MMTPIQVSNSACSGMRDPDLMAAVEYPDMVRQARRICAHCPLSIRLACLAEGLEIRDAFMVRGGTTPTQRAALPEAELFALAAHPSRFLDSSTARNPAKVMLEHFGERERIAA